MILGMYSICDKATSYIYPFPAYSDQAAVRNFATEINNSPVSKDNPGDFDLYLVANFDTEKGIVKPVKPTKLISNGMNVIKREVIYGEKSE